MECCSLEKADAELGQVPKIPNRMNIPIFLRLDPLERIPGPHPHQSQVHHPTEHWCHQQRRRCPARAESVAEPIAPHSLAFPAKPPPPIQPIPSAAHQPMPTNWQHAEHSHAS